MHQLIRTRYKVLTSDLEKFDIVVPSHQAQRVTPYLKDLGYHIDFMNQTDMPLTHRLVIKVKKNIVKYSLEKA